MFKLVYMSKSEVVGTIRFKERVYGIGIFIDVNGKEWDVKANFGNWICAKPLNELHPYYTDTSGRDFGLVSEKWLPYLVENE